jgi:hypothetical protein
MNIIEEILNKDIVEYNFKTIESMDNYRSMDRFIRDFDLEHHITSHEGTYVELDGIIGVHSGGDGDFYSHKIRFEIL